MAHYFNWKRTGEHAPSVLGPFGDAPGAQASRDAVAAENPGDEVGDVYEANPATVLDPIPRPVARVASGEGEVQVWSDGFTEVIGG